MKLKIKVFQLENGAKLAIKKFNIDNAIIVPVPEQNGFIIVDRDRQCLVGKRNVTQPLLQADVTTDCFDADSTNIKTF